MAYRPPKGVRPPQLEGKRAGRPKGSRNHAIVWADVEWACRKRYDESAKPPTPAAGFWHRLAVTFSDEFEFWVQRGCRVADADDFYDGY